MWYNKIVMNKNNEILSKEKYFVKDVYELYEGLGMDIMGNYICEFWSKD
jgi:hypothetical protein